MFNKPFNYQDVRLIISHIETMKTNLDGLRIFIEGVPVNKPCNMCLAHQQGFCKKWKETIPAEIIERGCEGFEFNNQFVPF